MSTESKKFGQDLAEMLFPKNMLSQPDPPDAPLRVMQNAQGIVYFNRPATAEELDAMTEAIRATLAQANDERSEQS